MPTNQLVWFYTKFFALVVLRVLLTPIYFILECAAALLWAPKFKYQDVTDPVLLVHAPMDVLAEGEKALDVKKYVGCGDGPKFLGMLYASSQVEGTRIRIAKALLDVIDHDKKTLLRYPAGHQANENAPAFSGDMLSGYIYGLASMLFRARSPERENVYISDSRFILYWAVALRRIFQNFVFAGMPFKIPHAFKTDMSRGFIWTPWEPGYATFQSVRAFLRVAIEVEALSGGTMGKHYSFLYRVLSFLSQPSKVCPDFAVFLGKYYYKSWYTEHTTALNAATEALLFLQKVPCGVVSMHPPIAVLDYLAERYPWNADIQALCTLVQTMRHKSVVTKYLKSTEKVNSSIVDILPTTERAYAQISGYPLYLRTLGTLGQHEERAYNSSVAANGDYFSLASFVTKNRSLNILHPTHMGGSFYLWEGNRIDYEGNEVIALPNDKLGLTLDTMFAMACIKIAKDTTPN